VEPSIHWPLFRNSTAALISGLAVPAAWGSPLDGPPGLHGSLIAIRLPDALQRRDHRKLAAELAPPEPQLQHAALRLTARGWETSPLPAPDGSGAFVAEFGQFTKNTFEPYGVAVDNACALHEPPLTGAACKTFDPSDGTVQTKPMPAKSSPSPQRRNGTRLTTPLPSRIVMT
jgi:hypothetical protein